MKAAPQARSRCGEIMRDEDCVAFLKLWLPRLGLRWTGYRKVRRTVCKRMRRHLRAAGLDGLEAYAAVLENCPAERQRLDAFCRIPISRFYRDRKVFEVLGDSVLAELAEGAAHRGDAELCCLSIGCASGEEPYSLRIAWIETTQPRYPDLCLSIVATDADPAMLRRAERARYAKSSMRDLPRGVLQRAFIPCGETYCLRPAFKEDISFRHQDIRSEMPDGLFDLILCRNLAFTYFERELQKAILSRLDARLRPEGYLVIGSHEQLPPGPPHYGHIREGLPILRRTKSAPGAPPS